MIRLPRNATDEQILDAVRAWVELLAQERYKEASEMLRYHPADPWSPELIRAVVTNYGFIEPREDGAKFKVTSLKDNPAGNNFRDVQWWARPLRTAASHPGQDGGAGLFERADGR